MFDCDPLSIYIGNALAAARKGNGQTQQDVATLMGTTASAVCYWERGRSEVNMRRFIQLCSALNVDPADILTAAIQDGAHLVKPFPRQEPR